ncbi:NADPH-dependent F420 reductase [Micropruina sp.]|uniref:NADPH-dependent F420 reductase n=1 Tax=Micropruina sp. TaxID=2737536 RepID=UPI0039E51947
MSTVGIVGAGNIGTAVAKAAVGHGYDVVIANSRGPETLTGLVAELGPRAEAGTVADAASRGDLVVVAVPLKSVADLDPAPFAGKTVVDANNYYPQRDGQIAALDDESTTTSELVQHHLAGARVVKAFNHIPAAEILSTALPAGASDRRALIVAGDDEAARAQVAEFLDTIGFDVLDLGPLSEGWRIQRDTPGYVQNLNRTDLASKVAEARRYRDM